MAPLTIGALTKNLGSGEAHIFAGTVEEGQAGFGACGHGYPVPDLRVQAHLTVGTRTDFLQLQGHVFVLA